MSRNANGILYIYYAKFDRQKRAGHLKRKYQIPGGRISRTKHFSWKERDPLATRHF